MQERAVQAEQHSLTGHRGPVLAMRVHQERRLFSASEDGTIKVRKRKHGAVFKTKGHRMPRQNLCMQRKAHVMALISAGWRSRDYAGHLQFVFREQSTCTTTELTAQSALLHGPRRPSSQDGSGSKRRGICFVDLQVWDLDTFACVQTLDHEGKAVQLIEIAGTRLHSVAGRTV